MCSSRILAASLVAFGSACAPHPVLPATQPSAEPAVRTRGSGGLALAVSPVEFRNSWHTSLRVTLQNTSEDWLWVHYGGRDFDKAFWFEVTDEQADVKAGYNCAGRSEIPARGLYVMLGPGGEYSWRDSLDCYAVNRRGPWRVTARFKETALVPDPAPPHAVFWFVGEATSNSVQYVPAVDYPGIPAP